MKLFVNIREQRGFTLLLAALVASIVVSIGAAVYSIATKELNLSSVGRDSQFAFYAADTGSECALYYDINRQWFSTSTPPSQIACGGATTTVTSVSNSSGSSNGSQNYMVPGTYTFVTPNQYGTLTVTVNGAGGGGGGGAVCSLSKGTAGTAGTNSSFNSVVTGTAGGGGAGAPVICGGSVSPGSNGTGVGGDTNTTGGGAAGGTGGASNNGFSLGGAGGAGGQAVKTYASSVLGTGQSITVVVGTGGTGGKSGGGAAQPGGNGGSGSVLITWTGAAPVWSSTTFSFQTQTNGTCAETTFVKALVAGAITNDIHSDGSNVPCSATTTSPRALQRSVEIKY